MSQHRTVNIDLIFGHDEYADYLRDRAELLYGDEEDEQYDDSDPEPPTPAAPVLRPVVPLWASMLAASDGRRGVDSRASRMQRRESAARRCA